MKQGVSTTIAPIDKSALYMKSEVPPWNFEISACIHYVYHKNKLNRKAYHDISVQTVYRDYNFNKLVKIRKLLQIVLQIILIFYHQRKVAQANRKHMK